jgi:hypothetical protein
MTKIIRVKLYGSVSTCCCYGNRLITGNRFRLLMLQPLSYLAEKTNVFVFIFPYRFVTCIEESHKYLEVS